MTCLTGNLGLAINEVKIHDRPDPAAWYASVGVSFIGDDGRTTSGWVHVTRKEGVLAVDAWDAYETDVGAAFEVAIGAERERIIAAVKQRTNSRAT